MEIIKLKTIGVLDIGFTEKTWNRIKTKSTKIYSSF